MEPGNRGLASHWNLRLDASACVISLGCPKNLVDSEVLAGSLARAGYRLTADTGKADLIVVTTCAFIGSAVRESEQTVKWLTKRKRPGQRLAVAGCLVERFGPSLGRRLPGIDFVVPLSRMSALPELLSGQQTSRRLLRPGICSLHSAIARTSAPRLLSTPSHYAYLKIAEGCNNHCSYCLIPSIRGSLRSRPMDELVEETRTLARNGVKELILVAQDTTAYGQDVGRRHALPRLLERLARIHSIRWLRLMYAHPAHITDELMRQFETNPKLCHYLDLPLQHVSDSILKRMNRRYTRRDIEELLARLRTISDIRLRTTFITGFPGETQSDFSALLEFVRYARFDRLGAFAYSAEPGTRAASLPGRVPLALRQKRRRLLMHTQAAISRARLRGLLGSTVPVLIDRPGLGRTPWDAPEIDGTVKLIGPCPPSGSFIYAAVTRTSTHDLQATPLKQSAMLTDAYPALQSPRGQNRHRSTRLGARQQFRGPGQGNEARTH